MRKKSVDNFKEGLWQFQRNMSLLMERSSYKLHFWKTNGLPVFQLCIRKWIKRFSSYTLYEVELFARDLHEKESADSFGE